MLQRIQTIYLLLATIAAIVFLFVPFGKIHENGGLVIMKGVLAWPFIAVCGAIAAISFLSIFLFNNRKLQMKSILFDLFLSGVLIGLSTYAIVTHQDDDYQFGPAVIIPVFVLIFIFLAYKGVKHDEELVRSMDRLR